MGLYNQNESTLMTTSPSVWESRYNAFYSLLLSCLHAYLVLQNALKLLAWVAFTLLIKLLDTLSQKQTGV